MILKAAGFTRHDFVGFDDPQLVAGSILYLEGDGHVEIYAGRYSETLSDQYGNPLPDVLGQPVSIGAKGWDRKTAALSYPLDADAFCILDEDEPSAMGGDFYQPCTGNWWCGEVSGGRADSYYGEAAKGSNKKWGCYYAPPQKAAG